MNIVLAAGLWLDGTAWDAVVPELQQLGHRATPVLLPGQGDGSTAATLADQAAAVIAAVDAAAPAVVVGHSAACTLAWIAADARPDAVTRAILIGGFPAGDGDTYAGFFDVVEVVSETSDGRPSERQRAGAAMGRERSEPGRSPQTYRAMPFPGWEPFDGPDTADFDDALRERIAAAAVPVPEGVSHATVRLADDRRYAVPVTIVCPEFGPDDARGWVASGDVPELARAAHVDYVDLDSGHWPMFTAPAALARVIADAATG